jgi:hypothetical protein
VVVSVGLGIAVLVNTTIKNNLKNFLSTPEVTDTLAEYDNLKASNKELAVTANAVDNVWKYVDSYPTYNRELENIVNKCAEGLADVTIKDFNSTNGTLGITTTASDVDRIHTYIDVLKNEPVFCDVNYTGYSYNSSSGDAGASWTVRVECKLSDVAGKSLSNIYSTTGVENYQKIMGAVVDETETQASTEEVGQ